MIKIGDYNKLRIVKEVDFGLYLDGEAFGEILLPKRYVPEQFEIDQELDVFIYNDSEDRIIATTEHPLARVGDFAVLKVLSTTAVGAFLDWGLPKDLLVPYREQATKMIEGEIYLVAIYLDEESKRVVASSKLDKFIDNIPPDVSEGDEVDIIVSNPTELGYRVIVNNLYWGMLYKSEIFQHLGKGESLKAYVTKIRDDFKIDLSLNSPGYKKIDSLAEHILNILGKNNGYLPVNDKSSAENIYDLFQQSKKTFKKAIGGLYKRRLIEIKDNGIYLVKHKAAR